MPPDDDMSDTTNNIPITRLDDENWKVFASVCIAAMFELLLNENRKFVVQLDRVEDIRHAMAHKMVAMGMTGPDEDGNLTFEAMLESQGLPN